LVIYTGFFNSPYLCALVFNCVPERSICLYAFVSSATGHRIFVKFNNSGQRRAEFEIKVNLSKKEGIEAMPPHTKSV
jgi:hypothetical protein